MDQAKGGIVSADDDEDVPENEGILDEIERLAGSEVRAKMIAAFGGTRIHIPTFSKLGSHNSLVRTVGLRAAQKLSLGMISSKYACRLWIPRGEGTVTAKARQVAIDAILEGKSAAQAARLSGLHQGTIHRYKRKLRSEGKLK